MFTGGGDFEKVVRFYGAGVCIRGTRVGGEILVIRILYGILQNEFFCFAHCFNHGPE